jgi:hypothetical protein
MKKLFVLAILVVLSVALLAVAGNVNSTDQKANQSSIKTPTQPGDVPITNAVEKGQTSTPVKASQPKQENVAPVNKAETEDLQKTAPTEYKGDAVIDHYYKVDENQPEATEPAKPTQAEKEADALNGSMQKPLRHQPKAEEQAPKAQGFDAQDGKWQPQYGPKGELLNPEPTLGSVLNSRGDQDIPRITETQLFYENFNGLWTGANPPAGGWAILDSGYVWDTYDWYRYASSTWGVAFARVYGSTTTQTNDDWLISPSIDLSVASTVTLNFRFYYDDNTLVPQDSGNVYLSDDGGATWAYLVRAYAGADTGTYSAPVSASYDVSAFAVGKSDIKVAFQYVRDTTASCGSFGVDNVEFVTDGGQVFFESMDAAGWGNANSGHDWVPPDPGWTANDNPDIWNNNDWHGTYYSTWGDTVANVYYSPVEWQNEWLITPGQNFSTQSYVHLRFKSFYDDYTGDKDTAWVLGTTDNWASTQLVTMYVGADSGSSSSPAYPDYDISSWAGGQSNVKIAFKYVGNNALYCWYLDNVEFYAPDPYNVATTAILVPPALNNLGNWPIASRVFNFGTQTATFQDSTYIIRPNKNVAFHEGFGLPVGWTGANPPTGWTVLDSGSVPGWDNTDWHQYYNSSSGDTLARVYYASGAINNAWLISPAVNATSMANVHLNFRTYFNWEGTTDTAYIYGSTDNWASRIQIAKWAGSDVGSSSSLAVEDFDISSWATGQSNVQVAFKYLGNYDLYWYVDDVEVYEELAPTVSYTGAATVTNLAPNAGEDVTLSPTWNTPAQGDYIIRQFTALAGDGNTANDTLTGALTVYPHTGSGGPDAGYYSFIDNTQIGGPTFNWIDMSSATPVTFSSTDAGYSWGNYMGGFFFYGSYYDSLYFSTDGLVSFTPLSGGFSYNYGIPSASGANNMVAFMWDDMVMDASSSASYLDDVANNRLVAEYDNIQFYGSPTSDTFDVQIIFDRTDWSITVQYANFGTDLQYDATVGIENAAGDIGLQYFYNTNLGNFPYDGLVIKFTYTAPSRDVAVNDILAPSDLVINGATFTPSVVMSNVGSVTENFNAYFKIFDSTPSEVYSQSIPVSLISGQVDTVDFPSTSITINGDYDCLTYIDAGDPTPANDTLGSSFTVADHYGTGGPDDDFYYWIDNTVVGGPTFSWVDMSAGTYVNFGGTDYGRTWGLPLGSFYYRGAMYDKIFLSTDGFASFDSITSNYYSSNYPLPYSSQPQNMIAFMWNDNVVSSSDMGARWLDDTANNRFVVEYLDTKGYGSYGTVDIQLIFDRDDSSIVIQYQDVHPNLRTDYGIGCENSTGTIGLNYYNNSVPLGNGITEGLAIEFYHQIPAHEVAVAGIVSPGAFVVNGATFTPQVSLQNMGLNSETFNNYFKIFDSTYAEVYSQSVNVTLGAGLQDTVDFPSTSISVNGAYSCSTYIDLGDPTPANDWATSAFLVDQHYGEGGPDAFAMYKWKDSTVPGGPTYSWIELNPDSGGAGTLVGGTSDADDAAYKVLFGGFSFPFYGTNYDSCWASSNGLLTFGASSTLYSNAAIPNASLPNNFIAPLWDDWYYRYTVGSRIFAQNFGTYMVIEWFHLAKYLTGVPSQTFEAILYADGSVIIQYHGLGGATDYDGSSSTLGIENSTGTSGLQYYYNTTPPLNIPTIGLAIRYYPFVPTVDVAVNSIDEPGFILLPGSYTITATLENRVATQLTLDSIGYVVQDTSDAIVYSSALYSQIIDPGTAQFSSPTTWNPTDGMQYAITVTSYLTTDEVSANNSAAALSEVQIPRAFPHVEDLETLNNWWIFYYGSSPGVYWTTTRSHSPTHSLYFSYNPYPRDVWLVGPPVLITTDTIPALQFWEDQQYWGDDPDETHGVALITDTFDFNNLTELAVWDTSHVINGFAGDPQEFDISAYIGHIVWPVFEYHAVNNGGNWYIDDIGMIEATAVAEIGVSPASISHIQETDFSRTFTGDFTISNTGTGNLNFSISNSLAWITPGIASGSVPAAGSLPVDLTINTAGIAVGTYNDNIVINSNDPANPEVTIPVDITVSQVVPDVDHFDITVNEGGTSTADFNISNGSSVEVHVELSADSSWLSVDPATGDISSGGSLPAQVTVDATTLTEGSYTGTVTIQSSNLILSVIQLPVNVTVTSATVCDYEVGDANGNGTFNGLDVTYSVAYFKGGPHPPYECECTPGNIWYVAGDVNGSCSFNGLDVTYMVAYFKGGPLPHPCLDCPPPDRILGVKSRGTSNGQ